MCSQSSLEMLCTDVYIITVRRHRLHTRSINTPFLVIFSFRRKPEVPEVQQAATHPHRTLQHKKVFITFPYLEELQHCRCSVFSLVAKEKALCHLEPGYLDGKLVKMQAAQCLLEKPHQWCLHLSRNEDCVSHSFSGFLAGCYESHNNLHLRLM